MKDLGEEEMGEKLTKEIKEGKRKMRAMRRHGEE